MSEGGTLDSVSEAETMVARLFGSFETYKEKTDLQNSICLPVSLVDERPTTAQLIRVSTVSLGQCHYFSATVPSGMTVLEESLLKQLATLHDNSDMHAEAFEGIKLANGRT